MMYKTIIFLFLCIVHLNVLFSQKTPTIKVSGSISNQDKKNISSVIISATLDDKKIIETSSVSNGFYELDLELQKNYILEFYKPEYITQKYSISTIIPKNEVDNFYNFTSCDVVLIENFSGLNTSLFDKSFQQVKWMSDETSLGFDEDYFDIKIRPSFKNLTNELKILKKQKYDKLVVDGDNKAKESNYEDAMIKYQTALKIIPNEKLAKSKLNESKKMLSKSISDEQAFKNSIDKGDEFLAKNKFNEAIENYEKAILYQPESILPLDKISLAEKNQLIEFKKVKAVFDENIKLADSLYKKQEFDEAWLYYNDAIKTIPSEAYPQKKINEIKNLTTQESAYNKAISKADKNLSDNKYDNAIKYYEKALLIKTDDKHSKNQINECNRLLAEEKKNVAQSNEKEEIYKKSYSKGLEYLNIKQYVNAKEQFTLALDVYPNDKNSKDRIIEIDDLLKKINDTQIQADIINNKYNDYIKNADKLYEQKRYNEAKKDYQLALKLKSEEYPKKRINDIENILISEKIIASKNISSKTNTDLKNPNITKNDTINSDSNSNKNIDISNDKITSPSHSIKQIIIEYENQLQTLRKIGNKAEEAKVLSQIGNAQMQQKNRTQALKNYQQSLKIYETQGNKSQVSNLYSDIAFVFLDSGKTETCIDFYEKSLSLKRELGDKQGEKIVLNDLAIVNSNSFRYERALDYYEKSLKLSENSPKKSEIANTLNDIAQIYIETKDFNKSITYLEKSLTIDNENNEQKNAASTMNNLGAIYYNIGNYKQSEDYYNKSLKVFEKSGEKKQTSIILNNIGNINYDLEKYTTALDYYERSLKIRRDINYDKGIANSLHNIGNVYNKLNQNNKAIDYYNQSNEVANKINYNEVLAQNYKSLSNIYSKTKNFEKAFEYSELYNKIQTSNVYDYEQKPLTEFISKNDEEFSENQQIADLKKEVQKQKIISQFEASRRLMEIELKNIEIEKNEEKYANQRILLYSFIFGFIIIFIFSILLYRLFVAKRKANVVLAIQKEEIFQQKEEISAQRDEIEQQRDYVICQRDTIAIQNKEITDSIQYASIIQQSILPPSNLINFLLPNNFILFKPRDIVSGDFYWITKKNDLVYLVAADCTGHGVPGAFMSMLGIAALNDIVNKNDEKIDANNVLNNIRKIIIESLHQTGEENESKDGMDISICVFDFEINSLQYSGAYNPLYLIRRLEDYKIQDFSNQSYNLSILESSNSVLIEFKGDKMPIGIYKYIDKSFTNNVINLLANDNIYLFSDGYIDQFGGEKGKKFKAQKFKELLVRNCTLSMNEQKNILENSFENWKGENSQVDDVIVIGIRI